MLNHFPLPITFQCSYRPEQQKEFISLLDFLSYNGFYGIELNLADLAFLDASKLTDLLDEHHLKLTYIATGEYAKAHNYSLSSEMESIRKSSIEGCKRNIEYAAEFHAGIIIGFMKGSSSDSVGSEMAKEYLNESLLEISEYAERYHVPVLLEATNRYEAKVANSLEDAKNIISSIPSHVLSILPDTFHMNIEEKSPLETISSCKSYIYNFHISDNNRLYPGLGCIDFKVYIDKLLELEYSGFLAIEGICKGSLIDNLNISINYLNQLYT